MNNWRINWPTRNIGPKLHMLEDHVVDFIRKWHIGLGFYGEQGGEGIHHAFKHMSRSYNGIKNEQDRLKYVMQQHLLTVCPEAQGIKPQKKKRKFKKEE